MDASKKNLLEHFSKFLTQEMGLGFPTSRLSDLKRDLERVASDLGFPDIESLIFDFTTKPVTSKRLQSLAHHLTVGETYFFRDQGIFEILESNILPDLIRARHSIDKKLRVWSAGCCTGEEAYSLAISIRKLLPFWRQWDIKILATDINTNFLKKAAAGIYDKWSFRTTSPAIRSCYFTEKNEDAASISSELRKMVTFEYLNLAENDYPSQSRNIEKYDIIFCRNVLMYFSAAQAAAALSRLCACLLPGGWLVLGPSELTIRPTKEMVENPFNGMHIYRKITAEQTHEFNKILGKQLIEDPPVQSLFPTLSSSELPKQRFEDSKPPSLIPTVFPKNDQIHKQAQKLLHTARSKGNSGKFNEALALCDTVITLDKMNSVAHYLRGILLQEMGEHAEADQALKRSVYIDPNFVVAHFALGNLGRIRGRIEEAAKHFKNARTIASSHLSDEELPESGGLTIGRLMEILGSLT